MPYIGIGNSVLKNRGVSLSSYWNTLISATVEDAEPTKVVLTFPSAKTSLVASDFTIAGFTVSSASWVGAVMTLTLSSPVGPYNSGLVVTFVKTGQTHAITNNTSWATKTNLVIEGHSFMSATSKTMSHYLPYSIAGASDYNGAVSGAIISQLEERAATIDSKIKAGYKNVMCLWIGTNEGLTVAGSGATAYAAMKSYIQDRIEAGFDVHAYTITPRAAAGAQFEIERDIFNGLMRSDLAGVTGAYVLDTDTISALDDSTNLTYYSDGLHPTSYGAFLALQLFKTSVSTTYSSDCLNPAASTFNATLTAAKTGTGAGLTTLTLTVTDTTEIKITGGGLFYVDAAATIGESDTWIAVPAGGTVIRYIKVTSGTSTLNITAKANITNITLAVAGNAPTLGGDISQFNNLSILYNTGPNTFSGSVTGLPLTDLVCYGSNTLSGSLNGKTDLTRILLFGSNTVSVDLGGAGQAAVVYGITNLQMQPCNVDTYTQGATWSNATVKINPGVGSGLSSTEIDNMLIDMANSAGGPASKTITLQGSNAARTAASDAAAATLAGRGCTLVLN